MPPTPPLQDPPVIPSQDVLESLPAPVIRLLIIFSRPIRGLRVGLEVLCWRRGRRVESWMLVGIWWGVCLGSKYVFRYLLPPLLFLPLLPLSRLSLRRKPFHPTTTHTHQTLLLTLSDLHAINALLPPSPIPTLSDLYARFRQLGPRRLLRGLVVIWASWFILGRLIGFSSLLAILGSITLLTPSPPFAHLFSLLSKSLFMRRLAALVFLMAFGSPPDQTIPVSSYFSPVGWAKRKWATSRRPSLAFSFRPTTKAIVPDSAIMEDDEDDSIEPIYFKFEVHENQRWWMGLDWTSALLPNERPSWCDSHLLAVLPPASFSLPPSSSIILPGTDKQGGRMKRTATWRWYDDDWSIVRAGSGASATQTVPAVAPAQEDEGNPVDSKRRSFSGLGTSPSSSNLDDSMAGRAHSMAEQAFTKGLERLKARTTSPTGPPSPKAQSGNSFAAAGVGSPGRTSGEFQRGRKGSHASEDIKEVEQSGPPAPVETIVDKDEATDADGWVYGDNKWENMGPKGGLGRFTRRRRWQRRAILTETIQHLPPGPLEEPTLSSLKASPAPTVQDKKTVATARITKGIQEVPSPVPEEADDLSYEDNGQNHAHELERQLSRSKSDGSRHSSLGQGSKTGLVDGATATGVSAGSRDDALRMRLKKAMGNMGA